MPYETQTKAVSTARDFEIGIDESIVVLVERQERTGYLIAEEYSRGELPSQITIRNALTFSVGDLDVETDLIGEVQISCPHEIWTAIDTDTIELIPCPADRAYPVLFISKHGFNWMFQKVDNHDYEPLVDHLQSRFDSMPFATDRAILQSVESGFAGMSLHQPKTKRRRDNKS